LRRGGGGLASSSRIRLRYSGLAVFGSRLFQILTGFIFTIAVTRNLTTHEFGVWQNIGDLQGYFTVFATALPSWQVRYLARGRREAGKTGILLNLLLSLPFAVAFLTLSPIFAKAFATSTIYYALAALQVVELYLIPSAEGLSQALKPQVLGYAQVLREIVKLGVAVPLIIVFKLGILGAIVAVAIMYGFDITYLLYNFKDLLKEKLRLELAKDWAKGSLFTLYGTIAGRVGTFDALILITVVGVNARALYGAASVIGSLITYPIALSIGLYPRLLAGGGRKEIETTIKTTYLFAFPMAAGAIIYAESFLTILNPTYTPAKTILTLIAVGAFFACFSSILDTVIYGLEKVDLSGKLIFQELLKSNFFRLPTIWYLLSSAYLIIVYLVTSHASHDPIGGTLRFITVNLVFTLIGAVIRYRISQRIIHYAIPKDLFKYSLAALVMAVVLYILPAPKRIIAMFSAVSFGATLYFGILAIIDPEIRILTHYLLDRLKKKMRILRYKVAFKSGFSLGLD
jgi:O-antigen/teichoic acid export membrane protein